MLKYHYFKDQRNNNIISTYLLTTTKKNALLSIVKYMQADF